MASYTPNKALPLPTVGGDQNLWGTELNNGLGILDSALGGQNTTTIAAAGGIVTISAAGAQNIIQKVTGAPTANAALLLAPNQGGFFVFENECTGTTEFSVAVGTTGALGGVVTVPNGTNLAIFSDGTNAAAASSPYTPPAPTIPPPGIQFGDMKHSGIGVEGSGWRLCNGQTRPQTDPLWTYVTANSIAWPWGHTGSSTYNMPNAQDVVLAGLDGMGGAASPGLITQAVAGFNPATLGIIGGNQNAQKDTISVSATANTTISDPSHAHNNNVELIAGINGAGPGPGSSAGYSPGINTSSSATGISAATTVSATATSSLTGTSQNIQPVMMVPVLMYVGA